MTMTIIELEEYIKRNVDEVDLLELLNITAEDLVEAFHDQIEDEFDYLVKELELGDDIDE